MQWVEVVQSERGQMMKGVVFTEFMDMVEARWGYDLLDDVIEGADLPHGGAYTAVGTYPFAEMGRLVAQLSARTEVPAPVLLEAFGRYLLGRFAVLYPVFFQDTDLHEFLASVDQTIHTEVRALYPDAELPRFAVTHRSSDRMTMHYRSRRCLSPLGKGLIEGAIDHFGQPCTVRVEADSADGSAMYFHIERAA